MPAVWSLGIHLLLVLALVLLVIPSEQVHEKKTEHFRVQGVKNLPRLPGKSGGGQWMRFSGPAKFIPQGNSDTGAVQDVSLQALTQPSAVSLKKIAVEVEPKKTDIQDTLFSDGRDFQALLTKTQENQLRDKVRSKQRAIEDRAKSQALVPKPLPGQETLLRFLQKPLTALELNSIQSVRMDPEEGMPGFTPSGSGGGGGGGQDRKSTRLNSSH